MPTLQLAADPSAIAPIPAAVLALAAFLLLMFVFLRPEDVERPDEPEQAPATEPVTAETVTEPASS